MPPASQSRIYQALKRLLPRGRRAWEEDTSSTLRELNVDAYLLGEIGDLLESLLNEFMPDTTNLMLGRFLSMLSIDVKPNDTIDAQRSRLLAKLRRQVGYTVALLQQALALPFSLTSAQVQLVEVMRSQIDAATTHVVSLGAGVALPLVGAPLQIRLGLPWPGNVDDTGVQLQLDLQAAAGTRQVAFQLFHQDGSQMSGGTTWISAGAGTTTVTSENRSAFLGKPAGAGRWLLSVWDATGAGITLEAVRLRVSNDVDAPGIYRAYAFRDPSLSGTPDLIGAQVLLTRTALAHVLFLVCQRLQVIADDPLALADRDPIGA